MNTAIVWVLSFTVLGVTPEHKSFAKYKTKQECDQALEQTKLEYKAKKKHIAGSCTLTMK
jgi:hypothetical protein